MHAQGARRPTFRRVGVFVPSLLIAASSIGCSSDDSAAPSFSGSASSSSTAASSSASSGGGGGNETPCPAASSTAIQLETPTGTLSGTLELPAGCRPFPAVLFHAGSGPTDRDGNGPTVSTDCTKQLAEALASRAIASVRYDKRGVAASAVAGPFKEEEFTFDLFVNDAAAWVTQLSADPRFKGISVAGHSEGSLIGILAAQRSPVASLISLEGAGHPAGEVLRTQLGAQLSGADLAEANRLIDELEAGHTVETSTPALQSLFRPSVQPYLITWFALNPATEIAKLNIPILVVQGTTDIQVGMSDADLLVEANPKAQLLVLEGMNHVFKFATLSAASQRAAYGDPSLPVVQELIDGVAAFVGAHARL